MYKPQRDWHVGRIGRGFFKEDTQIIDQHMKNAQHQHSLGKCRSKQLPLYTNEDVENKQTKNKMEIQDVHEKIEKLELANICGGNLKHYSLCGNQFGGFSKG